MSNTMLAAMLYGAKDIRVCRVDRPELLPGMVLLRVRRTGICGSDLHYYEHGDCGPFVPTRPFILGHELAAEVTAVGDGVSAFPVGLRVTVNPTRACGTCDYCMRSRRNLCRQTVMLGSASTTPPTDGAFAEFVTVRADQCHILPDHVGDDIGAMIEPLAVALHAIKRAGSVSGKRVLVSGGGPIGLLVAMAARAVGATLVALTDCVAERRTIALGLGADVSLDPANKYFHEQVRELTGDGFDVILEASGARLAARQAFDLVRPGGIIVQIGTIGTEDLPLPANQLMVREIQYVGSFRYENMFAEAILMAASRRLTLNPIISCSLPLAETAQAMTLAADKVHALKVQIEIN